MSQGQLTTCRQPRSQGFSPNIEGKSPGNEVEPAGLLITRYFTFEDVMVKDKATCSKCITNTDENCYFGEEGLEGCSVSRRGRAVAEHAPQETFKI